MIEYDTSSARPGRARAEVSKIGHGCRKWMAYRFLRCRSIEVLKSWGASTNEQMVVEMPMKWHERIRAQMSEWTSESMNQWITEPMNQWINEWRNWAAFHVPKVLRSLQFFEIFVWNRALATVSCTFCQLHCLTVLRSLHMLLSLQSGAHFADLLFQKCSERHCF